MIANYGYKDGSGEYYISIDTDKCISCEAGRACLTGCPKGMFETMVDDYDDEVVQIKQQFRKNLAYDCADCKPASGRPPLPASRPARPGRSSTPGRRA